MNEKLLNKLKKDIEFPRIVESIKEYGGPIKQYSVEYVSENGTIISMPYFELKDEAEAKLKELQEKNNATQN